MLLDVMAPGAMIRPVLWFAISICFWCASYGRSKKYKNVTKKEEAKKIKIQSIICIVLAIVFLLIALLDFFSPSRTPYENQWEEIEQSQNEK